MDTSLQKIKSKVFSGEYGTGRSDAYIGTLPNTPAGVLKFRQIATGFSGTRTKLARKGRGPRKNVANKNHCGDISVNHADCTHFDVYTHYIRDWAWKEQEAYNEFKKMCANLNVSPRVMKLTTKQYGFSLTSKNGEKF